MYLRLLPHRAIRSLVRTLDFLMKTLWSRLNLPTDGLKDYIVNGSTAQSQIADMCHRLFVAG
jgi:hypothetical protein